MSREKYVARLTDDERESLRKFVRRDTNSVREPGSARILLKADAGRTVLRTSDALEVSRSTACRVEG